MSATVAYTTHFTQTVKLNAESNNKKPISINNVRRFIEKWMLNTMLKLIPSRDEYAINARKRNWIIIIGTSRCIRKYLQNFTFVFLCLNYFEITFS